MQAAISAEDPWTEAEANNQVAWFSLQLGLPDRGHLAAVNAKRIWASLNDVRGQAVASSILSWLLVEMGLVDEGFAEAAYCLELAERQPDRQVLAFARNAKAITYLYCRQDHLALPLIEQALDALEEGEAPSLRALLLVNAAYSTVSLAEADEHAGNKQAGLSKRRHAVQINDAAIATASECGDYWNLRTALCNGAEYYAWLGDIPLAERCLEICSRLPGESGLRSEIHWLYTQGEVLTKTGRLDDAIRVCRQAVELADGHKQADHKANTNRRLAEALEASGDHAGALLHYKKFHEAFEAQMGETTRRRAQHVESALETDRLRHEASALRHQANHDPLTGLPNRRSFDASFASLASTDFCLAIVDLDHFKSVNDRHSHLVGDEVLKRVSATLAASPVAEAFRLGGEEFALLFRAQTLEEATAEAERIRLQIASADWQELSAGLVVTASMGLASCATTAPSTLMETADRLLYRAKSEGRNRVISG